MNRKPLALAPSTVTNVARSHSRATSHVGSGGNTEMRAQVRKVREHDRLQRLQMQDVGGLNNEDDPTTLRQPVSVQQFSASLSASISDRKIGRYPSSGNDQIADISNGQSKHLRVLPSTSSAMSSDNMSGMSTASSQMSSSSSAGGTRKLSENVSTQEQQETQPHPSNPKGQAYASHQYQHEQAQHAQQEAIYASIRADSRSCARPVTEPSEQLIGIDALQAAFSAKYYELANKCKNWETYAAKLRAHIGVLEAENRVLKEQNTHLESNNVYLKAIQRHEEMTRMQRQDCMSSLEDCVSHRSAFDANLDAQYGALETMDCEHFSLPSAPSSVEKNGDSTTAASRTPYCSSNLHVEECFDGLPSAMHGYQTEDRGLQATATILQPQLDDIHSQTASDRGTPFEAMPSKWDSCQVGETNQSRVNAGASIEGRSSRLGTRSDVPTARMAHRRSGTVGAFGLLGPRSESVMGASRVLSSQNLTQNQQEIRPASAQRFYGTYLESNVATTATSIVAAVGATKAALQSKRRSTVSGYRGPSLSLAQIVKGALTASGVMATQSRQTSPDNKAMTTSDYLQECVGKRREAMRSSFSAQQKGMTPATFPGGRSRPPSRAASRLSTQSGTRSRSRTGSVHDAIPVAVEDVFCNPGTYRAHPADPSPEFVTRHLAAASLDSPEDTSLASKRLMASTEIHARPVQLNSRKEMSIAASPSLFMSATPARDSGNEPSVERQMYLRFRDEMDDEEFQKFERCIQRYDWSEIPLEGNKGLITRVKRILLVSDPDLRSKPEKLRRRQQLARDFDSMAKHFSQTKRS